jgi:hypothetical protein
MNFKIKLLAIIFCTITLISCGGGGEGEKNSSNYTISSNTSQIKLEGFQFSDESKYHITTNTIIENITINYAGDGVVAGVIPGEEGALSWLDISVIDSSSNHVTYAISATWQEEEAYTQRSTTLRFVTGKADGSSTKTLDIPFSYYTGEYFYTNSNEIHLIKVNGAEVGIIEYFELKTPNSSWSISSKPDWVDIANIELISENTHKINILCNKLADSSQSNKGKIQLKDNRVNSPIELDVSCDFIESKMLPEKYGVALTQLNNIEKLTDSIKINSSSSDPLATWSASSNKEWLTVTNQGGSNDFINISAAPTNLEDNKMHYADIKIIDDLSSDEQIIKVGMYKNIALLAPNEEKLLNLTEWFSISDPIRPYIYYQAFNQNDGVVGHSSFVAYNIYSEQMEYAINLPDQNLNCLIAKSVSPDGSAIYFTDDLFCKNGDGRSNPSFLTIYNIDLFDETHSINELTQIDSVLAWDRSSLNLEAVINNGFHALILPNEYILDATTGNLISRFTELSHFSGSYSSNIKSTANGKTFFISMHLSTTIYELSITAIDSVKIQEKASFPYNENSQNKDAYYIHPDGDFIFYPDQCFRIIDGEWSDNCDKKGLQYIVTLPDQSILSSFWVADDSENTGVFSYDKELTVIKKISDDHILENPHVSADGLFSVGYYGYNGTDIRGEKPNIKYIPLVTPAPQIVIPDIPILEE